MCDNNQADATGDIDPSAETNHTVLEKHINIYLIDFLKERKQSRCGARIDTMVMRPD